MRTRSALFLVVMVTGIGGCNPKPTSAPPPSGNAVTPPTSPNQDGKGPNPETAKEPDQGPVYTVDALKYIDEWQKDRKGASAKYGNANIEVTGIVTSTGDTFGSPEVVLGYGPGRDLYCFTVDKEPWARVVPGQKIRLKGKQTPASSNWGPHLEGCQFLEAPPIDAIEVTAKELASAYGKDKAGVSAKYKDRYLIITGDVSAMDRDSFPPALELEGEGNVKLRLIVFGLRHKEKIAPGKPVKVIAKFNHRKTPEESRIHLSHMEIITGSK